LAFCLNLNSVLLSWMPSELNTVAATFLLR
jgi:hypothetical protein